MMSRLVLGTAQLGFDYGVVNATGQPSLEVAAEIVSAAWEAGVREFDTARVYGNSEQVLGRIFTDLGICGEALVTTKLAMGKESFSVSEVLHAAEASVTSLRVDRLHGVMLHLEDAMNWDGVEDIAAGLVQEGFARHVGVSVYSPEAAKAAVARDWVSMVQLPANVFDRRFERAGVFELVEKSGKALYLRSVLLQGLLVQRGEDVPESLGFVRPFVERFSRKARESGMSQLELAMAFARDAYPEARVLFGAETPRQVVENVRAWEKEAGSNVVGEMRKSFADVDEKAVDPRRWPMYS